MTAGADAAVFVHPTAEVEDGSHVGAGTSVWNWTKVRAGARIGTGCRIGQGVYVDTEVTIGNGCKLQNGVSVYRGVTLGNDVFVGPGATFTNDRVPRAASGDDWDVVPTVVEDGASIGANATVICGTRLGHGCMVGAGSVVTRDVPPYGLVLGNPARLVDYVADDGSRLHVGPHQRVDP